MTTFLNLPKVFAPARTVTVTPVKTGKPVVLMDYKGAGCIRRFQTTIGMKPTAADLRQLIIRMYWDGLDRPAVESPLGDFLGMVNGVALYPMNSRYINLQFHSISTMFFPMPFAKSARIEVEAGEGVSDETRIFWQVDFHKYPAGSLEEPMRFHAKFRREFPCEAFGRNYTLLDAMGKGRLAGYLLGVRVYDDRIRWSHAGGEHIYVANEPDSPQGPFAHLRSLGGETPFSAGHGGTIHRASTHLDQGIPYYEHEEMGTARAWQRIIGYRFFEHDSISFDQSIHFRFGSAANDICSVAYWYQVPPHVEFFSLPPGPLLMPGAELRRGEYDLIDETPTWRLCGPFHPEGGRMMREDLPVERGQFDANAAFEQTSYPQPPQQRAGPQEHIIDISEPWAPEGFDQSVWRRDDRHVAGWKLYADVHGFVDFSHVFRPIGNENTVLWPAIGFGETYLHADSDSEAEMQVGWVCEMSIQINDEPKRMLPRNLVFDSSAFKINLKSGRNRLRVKLHNPEDAKRLERSFGSWTFALRVRTSDGRELKPRLQ